MKVTIEITDPFEWQKLSQFLSELNVTVADVVQPSGEHSVDPAVSLQRGSGRHLIAYIADDFTAPSSDFNEYM